MICSRGRGNRSLSGAECFDFLKFGHKYPLGVPKVIGLLHPQPSSGTIAEQLDEANGDSRRGPLAPAQAGFEIPVP